MADEIDRKYMPEFLQTTFSVSLGACYRSFEMMKTPQDSFSAMTVYLLEGAAGLPVFSPHGVGGLAQLLGPTGGYLLAAPFAAALAGLLYRAFQQRAWAALAGAAAGDLLLLTTGALWLEALTRTYLSTLLHVSVLPFLTSDAAKVIAAAACALIFRSFATRTSSPAPQR